MPWDNGAGGRGRAPRTFPGRPRASSPRRSLLPSRGCHGSRPRCLGDCHCRTLRRERGRPGRSQPTPPRAGERQRRVLQAKVAGPSVLEAAREGAAPGLAGAAPAASAPQLRAEHPRRVKPHLPCRETATGRLNWESGSGQLGGPPLCRHHSPPVGRVGRTPPPRCHWPHSVGGGRGE